MKNNKNKTTSKMINNLSDCTICLDGYDPQQIENLMHNQDFLTVLNVKRSKTTGVIFYKEGQFRKKFYGFFIIARNNLIFICCKDDLRLRIDKTIYTQQGKSSSDQLIEFLKNNIL